MCMFTVEPFSDAVAEAQYAQRVRSKYGISEPFAHETVEATSAPFTCSAATKAGMGVTKEHDDFLKGVRAAADYNNFESPNDNTAD